ncbi:MAG: DUF4244 domain-containing protein [Mycobacteriales bacterium]|jgi:hypothetical protein
MWKVRRGDRGMITAEYAVGLFTAVAFALLLMRVVNSGAVYNALSGIVERALTSLVISGTAAW